MSQLALFSACGTWRYRLERHEVTGGLFPRLERLTFLMLNPSTADATKNDPTIRRCIGFARREGARHLVVGNLFAVRSPDPEAIVRVADPVGPGNAAALRELLATADPVVLAWGAIERPPELAERARPQVLLVRKLAAELGSRLFCLGTCDSGEPRHPLFVLGAAPLVPWSVDSWTAAC